MTVPLEEVRGGLRLGMLTELMATPDAPSPFVPTDHPDVALLIDPSGLRIQAVVRACPHRGLDLTQTARVAPDGSTLACLHRGYSWAAADGRPLSCGHRGPTAALTFLPTRVDADGVLWTVPIDEREVQS